MGIHVPVNNIIPFSLVDGPGSRCSVFLQGCNIACAYCHNPETQRLCVACGACVRACPTQALSLEAGAVTWDKDRCCGCDTCIRVCPHRSSPRIRHMDAREVFEVVASYRPFIRGITVSGGECMLYPRFLRELFSLCRSAGLGTLADTNGTVPVWEHPSLLDVTDGFMLDVKAWDPQVFGRLTGSAEASGVVRRNLAFLAEANKIEELRIVVVPGWNDPEDAICGIAATLGQRVAHTRLKLIRFRPFGVVGELAAGAPPSEERMQALEALARDAGFATVDLR